MKKLVIKKEEDVVTSVEEAALYSIVTFRDEDGNVFALCNKQDNGYCFYSLNSMLYYGVGHASRMSAIQKIINERYTIYCTNDINEFADWLKEG